MPRNHSLKRVAQEFGKLLRRTRESREMTQEDLAHSAELDISFVSRMERGLTQPSIGIFMRVSAALETTPTRLMSEIEKILGK